MASTIRNGSQNWQAASAVRMREEYAGVTSKAVQVPEAANAEFGTAVPKRSFKVKVAPRGSLKFGTVGGGRSKRAIHGAINQIW